MDAARRMAQHPSFLVTGRTRLVPHTTWRGTYIALQVEAFAPDGPIWRTPTAIDLGDIENRFPGWEARTCTGFAAYRFVHHKPWLELAFRALQLPNGKGGWRFATLEDLAWLSPAAKLGH